MKRVIRASGNAYKTIIDIEVKQLPGSLYELSNVPVHDSAQVSDVAAEIAYTMRTYADQGFTLEQARKLVVSNYAQFVLDVSRAMAEKYNIGITDTYTDAVQEQK